MGLRGHQERLDGFFREVEAGNLECPRLVGSEVCCGGGKQAVAGITAHWVVEKLRLADRVCWLLPNGTLRQQAAESLKQDKWLAKLYGHQLRLYESINDLNPAKDGQGYISTYHAMVADRKGVQINAQEFERCRYWLILDELHHLAVGSEFAQAVEPLVRRAVGVTAMTGQLDRADRAPIYLLEYRADGLPDLTVPEQRWFRYSIREGMRERAIIEVQFKLSDAAGVWFREGDKCEATTLGESRDALFTALQTEFADSLGRECLGHWVECQKARGLSKLLFVCASVSQAKRQLRLIERLGRKDAAMATYQDDNAEDSIKEFREERRSSWSDQRGINILVTVAKAYEGLDVPAITHLCCLTHIRSRQWIEQMIARAWRFDERAGPYKSQKAYIWAPDDKLFKRCMRHIIEEQRMAIREMDEAPGPGGGDGPREPFEPITPYSSALTDAYLATLTGEIVTVAETASYEAAAAAAGLPFLTAIEIKRICEAVGQQSQQPAPERPPITLSSLTPSEELRSLRRDLDTTIGKAARQALGDDAEGQEIGMWKKECNSALYSRFGPREAMNPTELREAIAWVKEEYAS